MNNYKSVLFLSLEIVDLLRVSRCELRVLGTRNP